MDACDARARCSAACEPAARFGAGARLTRGEPRPGRGSDANRIDCDARARCSATCEPAARLGAAPSATPEPEQPRRMTASQEASLSTWMIKTYLSCWKPPAQPADANRYVARVRLKFKSDR